MSILYKPLLKIPGILILANQQNLFYDGFPFINYDFETFWEDLIRCFFLWINVTQSIEYFQLIIVQIKWKANMTTRLKAFIHVTNSFVSGTLNQGRSKMDQLKFWKYRQHKLCYIMLYKAVKRSGYPFIGSIRRTHKSKRFFTVTTIGTGNVARLLSHLLLAS